MMMMKDFWLTLRWLQTFLFIIWQPLYGNLFFLLHTEGFNTVVALSPTYA